MHRDFGTSCWQLGDEIYVGTLAPGIRYLEEKRQKNCAALSCNVSSSRQLAWTCPPASVP
jgi:hypothetical protein